MVAITILVMPVGVITKEIKKPIRETMIKPRIGLDSEFLKLLIALEIFFVNRTKKLRPPIRPEVVRIVRRKDPDSLNRMFQILVLFK